MPIITLARAHDKLLALALWSGVFVNDTNRHDDMVMKITLRSLLSRHMTAGLCELTSHYDLFSEQFLMRENSFI